MPLSPRSAGAAAAAVSPVPGSKMAPGARAASARPPPRWRQEVASGGRKCLHTGGNGFTRPEVRFTRPEVASRSRKWLHPPHGCLRGSGGEVSVFCFPAFQKYVRKGAKLLPVERIGLPFITLFCARRIWGGKSLHHHHQTVPDPPEASVPRPVLPCHLQGWRGLHNSLGSLFQSLATLSLRKFLPMSQEWSPLPARAPQPLRRPQGCEFQTG